LPSVSEGEFEIELKSAAEKLYQKRRQTELARDSGKKKKKDQLLRMQTTTDDP